MDVAKLVEVTVTGLGYELVDFELSGRGLMRVLLDQADGIAVKDGVWRSSQNHSFDWLRMK